MAAKTTPCCCRRSGVTPARAVEAALGLRRLPAQRGSDAYQGSACGPRGVRVSDPLLGGVGALDFWLGYRCECQVKSTFLELGTT